MQMNISTHQYTYIYSKNVNCTSGYRIMFRAVLCDVMWCCSAAASTKPNSSAGCHNGSTLLGIRTDRFTHDWINDYKMPTSPHPRWNQPSWCEFSVPKHCPGKTNWDTKKGSLNATGTPKLPLLTAALYCVAASSLLGPVTTGNVWEKKLAGIKETGSEKLFGARMLSWNVCTSEWLFVFKSCSNP